MMSATTTTTAAAARDGCIAVVVRCRPSGRAGSHPTWYDTGGGGGPEGRSSCAIDESAGTVALPAPASSGGGVGGSGDTQCFKFDGAWDSGKRLGDPTDQFAFYAQHIKRSVDAALLSPSLASEGAPDGDGGCRAFPISVVLDPAVAPKHVAVIAYGQTGSGKTHTMDGAFDAGRGAKACVAMGESQQQSAAETDGCDDFDDNDCGGERGVAAESGIAPRVVADVFAWRDAILGGGRGEAIGDAELARGSCEQQLALERIAVKVSFVEIYNENLRDLLIADGERQQPSLRGKLAAAPTLRIRHTSDGANRRRAVVENLTTITCESAAEALALYRAGAARKQFRAHGMNARSSRSHTIFTVTVQYDFVSAAAAAAGGGLTTTVAADINLVDLAGSERQKNIMDFGGAANSASQRALAAESIRINCSLLALGRVIAHLSSAAVQQQQQRLRQRGGDAAVAANSTAFAPYRESKLTTLLQHAIGGNSRTIFVACIHPDAQYTEESRSTLYYASRARGIRNAIGAVSSPHLAALRALRAEVSELRAALEAAHATIASLQMVVAVRQHGHGKTNVGAVLLDDASNELNGGDGSDDSNGNTSSIDQSEKLVEALLLACGHVRQLTSVRATLEQRCVAAEMRAALAEAERTALHLENAKLRERLDIMEALAVQEPLKTPQRNAAAKPTAAFATPDDEPAVTLRELLRHTESLSTFEPRPPAPNAYLPRRSTAPATPRKTEAKKARRSENPMMTTMMADGERDSEQARTTRPSTASSGSDARGGARCKPVVQVGLPFHLLLRAVPEVGDGAAIA